MRKLLQHPRRQLEAEGVKQRLIIDPNAEPPLEKFYRLCERMPEVQSTWDRRRKGKWTVESYQAKLAHYATEDDWTMQEIANLIIKFRQKHSQRVELREDYYLRIISRVRLDGVCATAQEARELISVMVGREIKKIQRYLTDPPMFMLTVDGWDRPIELGDSNSLTRQESFRNVLLTYGGRSVMPKFMAGEWHQIVSRMTEMIESVEVSDETTHLGAATSWLVSYLRDNLHADRVEEAQRLAILDRKPGLMDDDVWFSIAGLKKHVKVVFGECPEDRDLAVRLSQLGCQFVDRKSFRTKTRNHCRSLWRIGKAWSALERKGLERPNFPLLREEDRS